MYHHRRSKIITLDFEAEMYKDLEKEEKKRVVDSCRVRYTAQQEWFLGADDWWFVVVSGG
jgi:hypothetical protein